MRLSPKAKNLLLAEVEKQAAPLNLDIQKSIVLKRFNKLTQEPGQPLAKEEMEQLVLDMFPSFDGQVLNKAARENQSSRLSFGLKMAGLVGIGLVGLSGLVWLVNLPYPMVRRPVAQVAPLLLLPSYLSMDRNYREAIAHVEQADQLVNQATSAADITLGAEKVKQAQANLDQLPVWFLGYEPIMICRFMGCSWHFTFDEFSRARAQVGRMDARIFQENNALNQLQSSETVLQQAKQLYEKAPTPPLQQAAIAGWKTALNQVALIPPNTLAGSMAQKKYQHYDQEFQQIAGWMAGTTQTQTMIAAAEQFGKLATQGMEKAPHSVSEWQGIQTLWQQAIERLKQVNSKDPDYLASQTYLAQYTQKLSEVQTRLETEQAAVQSLESAHKSFQDWLGTTPAQSDPSQQFQRVSQLQAIIDQLKKVQPGTTVYLEAQSFLKQVQGKLKQS